MIKKIVLILCVAAVASAAGKKPAPQPKLKEFKPGFINFFSIEQDIQLGKEAAAQVEQQFDVVKNPEIDAFIQNIGKKLIAQRQANSAKFPYSFKVVADNSVNAFALPGGSAFIHTGLIAKAENEAQIAAVLAHEISHVALRHGTHESSKANIVQIPAAIAAQVLGSGGLLGTLEAAGIGLLANGALLKFSRSAENEADLMGAQIMAQAGYNPIEMARFFEKLEAETGKGSWITSMMSDHPNPGNRVKNVENEILAMPKREYMTDGGGLVRAQAIVKTLPPPRKRVAPGATQAPVPANVPMPGLESLRPSGHFKTSENNSFSVSYPDNWQTISDPQGASITFAPAQGSMGQGQQMQLAYGAQFNFSPSNGQAVDIQAATQSLVQALSQGDPNMKVARNPTRTQVDGYQSMVTYLATASPFKGQNENDLLLTVALPQGVFWAVFVAPESDFRNVEPTYNQMIQSLRFKR